MCVELQVIRHDVLTAAFVVPVVVVVPVVGGVAGTRQVVWQLAACELHSIMRAVTFPVCASRIFYRRPANCVPPRRPPSRQAEA
jgi:hypothetical protein